MLSSRIVASGSYLPKNVMTNDDIAKLVDTNDSWIFERTGIRSRHIVAENELTSDLATFALHDALTSSGISLDTIDGIILATTTPDIIFPATAIKVKANLSMSHGFAFDIQAACSGFLYALSIANSMIISGAARRIAVLGADSMSKIVDWNDRSTCILFADGAGCAILERSENPKLGVLGIELYSDNNSIDILKVDGGVSAGNCTAKIQMMGREVFKTAVYKMSESLIALLEKLEISIEDLDWLLPHQANARIFQAMGEKLNIDQSKILSTLETHGNTSAASIPLALDHYIKENQIKPGQLVGMTAVGAGITWASAVVKF